MSFTKTFSEISKDSVGIAGGKGASLGEMTHAGIPVPLGYVVLADAFEQFLKETDINVEIDAILDKVDTRKVHTVENASEQIQAIIKNAKMPLDIAKEIQAGFKKLDAKYVAVRSSATSEDSAAAAWAGQLDSFLNTDKNSLLKNVQNCWASLFTPRAIVYRFEKGLEKTKISVAVVVQKMVQSEESGVAFSVHPITQDYNQIIIEASYGLGEAIVSGQVTPDSYVIDKQDWNILDKNIYTQTRGIYKKGAGNEWRNIPESKAKHQVLTDKEIIELAKIIMRIENHYAFPCDIEFAKEKGKFFIVQSRPITTLASIQSKNTKTKNHYQQILELAKTQSLDVKQAKCCMLLADMVFKSYSRDDFFGNNYAPIIIPYENTHIQQVFPVAKNTLIEKTNWENVIKNKKKFIKLLNGGNSLQEKIDRKSLTEEKVAKFSDKKLREYFEEIYSLSFDWWRYAPIGEDKGLIVDEKIIPLLMQNHKMTFDQAQEYAVDVSMPEEQSVFSKERMAFLDMAIIVAKEKDLQKIIKSKKPISKKYSSFLKKLNSYSKKYFYSRTNFYSRIAINEENLPKVILDEVNKTTLKHLEEERKQIDDEFKSLKAKQKILSKKIKLTKEEQDYLWYFKIMHTWIDDRKVSMSKHFYYLLIILEELSKRKKMPYQEIAMYCVDELRDLFDGKKLPKKIAKTRHKRTLFIYDEGRREEYRGKKADEMIKVINTNKDTGISGTIACKAGQKIVTGKVRIVHDPVKDIFLHDEILVTTMTRPEFVPIMKKAKAIITDEGGLTSHAAIVSRELKVPCIIGTKNISRRVKDGQEVEMNLDNGSVRIIDVKQKAEESVEYEPHQRYYTLPFTSWVFENLAEKDPYGYKMHPSFIYIKNNRLYHCIAKEDYLGIPKAWIKKYGKIEDLQRQLKEFKKFSDNFDKFMKKKKFDEVNDLLYLYDYVIKTTPFLILITFLPNIDCDSVLKKECSKLRVKYEDIHKKVIPVEDKLLASLAQKNNLRSGLLEKLSKKDFLYWLKTKNLPRYIDNDFILLRIEGKSVKILTSEKYLDKFKLVQTIDSDISEIKGTVAFSGKVKGKVVIVKTKADLSKVNDGDVLVTGMTDPSYVPVMKKASAFVTNEGGITCHAAIVARELKKPCIIGTKIAAHVLKDGQLVEVDASKGIVKILKK